MHRHLFTLFLIVILYGIYNAYMHRSSHKRGIQESARTRQTYLHKRREMLSQELARIDTQDYIVRYIVDVIDHGSDTLGFSGGVMEGGYVAHEDARKIACYVYELSGRKCDRPYPADAEMFYTSVCGGCHGNDGKGLGGHYPDLTRPKLLGIARREAFLKAQLKAHEKGNN